MLNHGDGLYTIYMHASSLNVSQGQTVTKGQDVYKRQDNQYSALIPPREMYGELKVGDTVEARVIACLLYTSFPAFLRDHLPRPHTEHHCHFLQ